MKYLVNRETKEHYRQPGMMVPYGPVYDEVDADDEGWIKWDGKSKKCPLPDDARCDVVFSYDDEPTCGELASYWNWDDRTLTHYRPILPAESKPEPLGYQSWDAATTYREGDKAMMPYDQVVTFRDITPGLIKKEFDSGSVFSRLSAAVAASEPTPALIAEINAMLPEGYEVREKAKTDPVEFVGEWKDGDALECALYTVSWWIGGKIYSVCKNDLGLYVTDEDGDKRRLENIRRCFKFHSRPVTK